MEHESIMCGSSDEYEMTRDELLEHYWKKIKFVMENKPEWHLKNSELIEKGFSWSSFQQNINPLTLTQGMFVQSMYLLTSDEQRAKYVPLIDNLNILGCYAQTELGHGSDVQGLETTATLDRKTDEWVINTPSIKAYKFWPGGLGRSATHAVVFASLRVDENNYGV